MDSKYLENNFSEEAIKTNITRLTNQLWKLIPMRENEEDWKKQLNTVIIEIAGLGEIFYRYNIYNRNCCVCDVYT